MSNTKTPSKKKFQYIIFFNNNLFYIWFSSWRMFKNIWSYYVFEIRLNASDFNKTLNIKLQINVVFNLSSTLESTSHPLPRSLSYSADTFS